MIATLQRAPKMLVRVTKTFNLYKCCTVNAEWGPVSEERCYISVLYFQLICICFECWNKLCIYVCLCVCVYPPTFEHVPVKLVKHHLHLCHRGLDPSSSLHCCRHAFIYCFQMSSCQCLNIFFSEALLCCSLAFTPIGFRAANCSAHREVTERSLWDR